MPDVNSYSLSLLLDLQSTAPVVLDDVSDRLNRINDQIATIADNYKDALGGAAESFATATEQIANSMEEVNQTLNRTQPIIEEFRDIQKERIEDLQEELDLVQQMRDVGQEVLKNVQVRADAEQQIADVLPGQVDGTGNIADNTNRLATNAQKVAEGFRDIFFSMKAIKTAFAEFIELEDQFITANYRLYGAQEEIVRQVNDISDQYDLLRGTAHEAMKSLAISLRVPKEELAKYVAQVSMFHRATGASISQTGDWIRSMTLAGFTSKDTERSLGRMVNMMRIAGLTTEQINKALQQQAEWTGLLSAAYGKEGVQAFNAGSMAMAALTREVHGDADAMMALFESIVRVPSALVFLKDASTLTADQLAGMDRAQQDVLKSASGMLNYFAEVDARTRGLDPGVAEAVFGGMGVVIGMSAQQMESLNIALKAMREEMGLTDPTALLARLKPMMEEFNYQNDLLVEFSKSMNTVKADWEKALRPLFNAWISLMVALKPVMQFIIELVGVLADVLAFLINTLAAIINPIAAFKRHLEGVNEAGEKTVGFFKRLGAGIANFVQALPGLIIGIAALVGLYFGLRLVTKLFSDWVGSMRPANLLALATAFLAIGASAVMVATALAIVASLGLEAAWALVILTAAMAGMAAVIVVLGKAARANRLVLKELAVTMLAIGAAAIMVAGAVWIVAEAMKTIAGLGWAALGAGVAVVGILAAMTAVLATLSSLGAPVVPIMLAVGAAFLIMGAAIWLTAKAFEVIVDSFDKLGKSAIEVAENAGALAAAVGIISLSLLELTAVGLVTALPLLVLGNALLVVGVAAVMIAGAFETAVKAIRAFADIKNVKDAVAGLEVAIESLMRTMAEVSYRWRWYLPLMVAGAGVLLAVGAAAFVVAKAMGVMADALEKFGDMDMIIDALKGVAVAMAGLAGIALVISPALGPMIRMGVAMMAIGAGAWLMAEAMSASAKAIKEFAEVSKDEILQVGRNLVTFGKVLAAAAASILSGSFLMLRSAIALGVALTALGVALWMVPLGRLKEIGAALGALGEGLEALSSKSISDIALRGDSFGELAVTIGGALDEIEEQALRADAIADSFVHMNEAIARALAGPPEPVYGDVANALRDKMDMIEAQAARAEAIYAPIEGIAEQAELALAMSGEPAAEAFAEPVIGGLGPGADEDVMETSNYINLRKQTMLLEKIEAAMPPEAIANALDKIVELPGKIGDAIEYAMEHPLAAAGYYATGGMVGLSAAATRHAGEDN